MRDLFSINYTGCDGRCKLAGQCKDSVYGASRGRGRLKYAEVVSNVTFTKERYGKTVRMETLVPVGAARPLCPTARERCNLSVLVIPQQSSLDESQ